MRYSQGNSQGTVKPDLRLESLNPINTTIATGEAPNFGDTDLRLSGEIHKYEQARGLSPALEEYTDTHPNINKLKRKKHGYRGRKQQQQKTWNKDLQFDQNENPNLQQKIRGQWLAFVLI